MFVANSDEKGYFGFFPGVYIFSVYMRPCPCVWTVIWGHVPDRYVIRNVDRVLAPRAPVVCGFGMGCACGVRSCAPGRVYLPIDERELRRARGRRSVQKKLSGRVA